MKNILCSYPRSGNHLIRFLIEILSELPTKGCERNKKDKPIYLNTFPEKINFNIKDSKKYIYYKYHILNESILKDCKNLIIMVRNPYEVLLRHNNSSKKTNDKWIYEKPDYKKYENYFKILNNYNSFKGNKLCLYYEDILIKKKEIVIELVNFEIST